MEPYIENSADATDEKQQKEQKSFKRTVLWSIVLLAPIIFLYLWGVATAPPNAFLPNTYIEIPKGTLAETATFLKNKSLIGSETIFLFVVQRAGKEKGVQSGRFYFEHPVDVF